jgi:hypothetical protein
MATDATGFAPTDLQAIENVVPTGVRQFIEHHFEQLAGEDQAILEAAGVAGRPVLRRRRRCGNCLPEERVEARCAAWARRASLSAPTARGVAGRDTGGALSLPPRPVPGVVYARTSPERRARLHQRIGARLEGAYGKGAAAIAAELAMHLEQGRDPEGRCHTWGRRPATPCSARRTRKHAATSRGDWECWRASAKAVSASVKSSSCPSSGTGSDDD